MAANAKIMLSFYIMLSSQRRGIKPKRKEMKHFLQLSSGSEENNKTKPKFIKNGAITILKILFACLLQEEIKMTSKCVIASLEV